MSDFLSSLRNVASRVLDGTPETQARRQSNEVVRQGADYRSAARSFTGVDGPSNFSNFRLQDNYSAIRDAERARAAALFASDISPSKSGFAQARDGTLDVLTGLTGGVLNLGALAASGISGVNRAAGQNTYDFGVPLSQFANDTSEFLGGLRTAEGQNAAAAYETSADVLSEENRLNEQAAIAEGRNPLLAGSERIFSDVVDAGGNLLRQPEAIGAGISQGVGSLAIGGPVARGVSATARAAAPGIQALSARGLLSPNAARVVVESVERGAMTGTIAAMEAGGAYNQAANAVMGMSQEELMANSDMYVELRAQGMTHERAQNTIASRAGSIAASIQAPLAAVTGRMVSKFEAAPLAGTTVVGALRNIGAETIEEGAQEFSGNLTSNIGVRLAADRTQDLGEGLGRGLAEGAVFGAGTGGVFAGPNVAAGVVDRVPRAVARTAEAILTRGQQINERNIVNPVTVAATAVQEAAAPAPVTPVAESVIDPVQDQAEIDSNIEVLESLGQQFRFDPTEYQPRNQAEADLIATTETGVIDDVSTAMEAAVTRMADESVTPEQKLDLALFVHDLKSKITPESYNQVLELQNRVTPGGTVAIETNKIVRAQEAIANSELYKEAIVKALEATPAVTVQDVEDISTPQGIQAAKKVAVQAVLTPESIDPEVVERLLKHSTTGVIAPQQVTALRSQVALNQTLKAAQASAQAMGANPPAGVKVAFDIQTANYDKSGDTGPSVAGHYEIVNKLANYGQVEDAKSALEEFRNFAQHMANKLNAVNASFNGRDTAKRNPAVSFQAYDKESKSWYETKKPLSIIRFKESSISLGQQIGVDAEYVIDSYNKLAAQYPEFGIQPVEQVRLDNGLRFPPEKIMETAKAAPDNPSRPKNQRAAKVEATPEAVTPTEPVSEQKQERQPEPETQLELQLEPEPAPIDRVVQKLEDIEKSIAELRAERDRREDDLINEPSVVIEDTAAPVTEGVVDVVAEPEAKPEVLATEETTTDIKDWFPDVVVDTNGENLLLDGFTLDNENRTRLVGANALTVGEIIEAFVSGEAFNRITGLAKSKISLPVTQAYDKLFDAVQNGVLETSKTRLANSKNFKPYQNGKVTNRIRTASLRLLNVLTSDGEKLSIDPVIEQTMLLAMADWVAQNSVANAARDAEDIAKSLGIPVEDVEADLIKAYNKGLTSGRAHQSLADTLTKFLGLKAKKNVKNGLSDGLMLSIAAELLDAAEQYGLIESTPIQIGEKPFVFLNVNREKLGLVKPGEDGPTFAGQTTLISQIVLNDTSLAGYTLNEPSGRTTGKLLGGGASTTEQQNAVELRENAVPHKVNKPIAKLFEKIGIDGVLELFANGSVLSDTLNENDRLSKEGQNLAFVSAYDTAMGIVGEMNAEGEDTQIFREYRFSSVNRLQQQGQFGDQASKLTRELITPYEVTLDMTDPKQAQMFRRGLAQALGVKIEKLNEANWEAKLQDILNDANIQNVIDLLKNVDEIPGPELVAALKAVKADKPVMVHALKAYADFRNTNDLTSFKTHMYVEADGVTDGPTNSLIYMRTGGFDVEVVRGLARGGLFFKAKPTALHEYFDPADRQPGEAQPLDTYEVTAKRLSESLSKTIDAVIGSATTERNAQELQTHASALLAVMRALLGSEGFTFKTKDGKIEFEIGRKQLKNPLTVTVYGSSPSGIAKKVAKEMVTQLYQQVSDAHQAALNDGAKSNRWTEYMFNDPETGKLFFNALNLLTSKSVIAYTDKNDKTTTRYFLADSKAKPLYLVDPVKLTVDSKGIEALSTALQTFYINPMVDAINAGMSTAADGSKLIQEATNSMSSIAKVAFDNLIKKAIVEETKAGRSASEGLSPDQMKKILGKVAFLLPYIEGDSITVNVKGLTKGIMAGENDSAVNAVATFLNNNSTKLTVPMPAIAGVAGAAYVNISYGDGRMIIEASSVVKGGRLMVFDGINSNLKDAEENGKAINGSVIRAIQSGTPFQDLEKVFNEMVNTINLSELSEAELKEAYDNITRETLKADSYEEAVQMKIDYLAGRLREAKIDEQARQAVLKRVHISSDHMAAIATPASTEAETNREDLSLLPTDEAIAERLNELFKEERKKLAQTAANEVYQENLTASFEGLPQHETGVRVTNTQTLNSMIGQMNLPAGQVGIIKRALAALANDKWTVVFGDREQANAYTKKTGIPFSFSDTDNGLAAPGRKTIIVANGSSETLAHELIHAATIDRVSAYYADPQSVDDVSRGAIRRLEALMNEWIENAEAASALRKQEIKDTLQAAMHNVQSLLDQGRQAEALNEFMAWNLSNQKLMKLNSTIKVENVLARISKSVVETLRKWFNLPAVGNDLDSNIRFNSMVLMSRGLPSVQSITVDRMLFHSSKTRADLADINLQFAKMVATADRAFEKFVGVKPSEMALGRGYQLAKIVADNGFTLTNEERQAFVQVVAAYRINQVADSEANVKLDKYYTELLAQMNQSVMMDDPDSQDPDQRIAADKRINLLRGSVELGSDIRGLDMRLAMFVALGATSKEAQKLFNRVTVRDRKLSPLGATLDEITKNKASDAMNIALDWTYGIKANQKVGDEVAKVVAGLIEESSKQEVMMKEAINTPGNLIRYGNEKLADGISVVLDKTSDTIQLGIDVAKGTQFEGFANSAGKVAQLGVQLMSKRQVEAATSKLTSIMNQSELPKEFRALISELMGVNEGNQDILILVKQGRALIDRIRQSYRKLMPQQIADKFTRKLTTQEWSDIHALGRVDVSVLLDQGLSSGAVVDLIADPAGLKRLMDQKQTAINQLFGADAPAILAEANELAQLMVTGVPAHGLVKRNALAIANRVGSATVGTFTNGSPETQAIDGYVSALAMSQVAPSVLKSLSALSADQRTGLENVVSLLGKARADEMERVPERLKYIITKGYMPSERKGSFKAVPVDKVNSYTKAGYRTVGLRQAGPTEALHNGRATDVVYVASDLNPANFKQGIMRTVRSTVFGLDAVTGAAYDNPAAGLITEPSTVKRITNALKNKNAQDNTLAPLYNEQGVIYAYERLVPQSEVKASIETQQNAAVSLGQWMGRQHEEYHASILNDVLIDRLTEMYESASRTAQTDEFVDLNELAQNDPVVADALRLMNDRDMSKVLAKMGGKFMVRKDLYEQVIGYRAMTIGDLWTGNSNLKEETREAIANYLTGMLGVEAYRRLTTAEQAWTNLMSDARVAIVVKSMLVPALNAMANFYQLMANGIGPVQIAQKSAEKLRETHVYAKNHLEHQRLEIELAAQKGAKRPDLVRRIETQIQKLEDINKRLSIWPLIEAGEFSQVTEGLTQDDMEMTQGRIWDHVSKLADKLPPAVKTAGRYAVIAKDTALFEGLARSVAYTDFVAKAVLYDHLTTKMKLDKKTGLLRITNEFVNYDLLGGRMREKAEDMGLVWFWKFKLRSIKVAASLMRNNPLNTFLSSMVPGSYEAGTVMDDNGLNLVLDGRFDNTLGFDNALRGWALLPVNQIL